MTRVAIVGCGGVGRKRAAALGDARLVACVDVVEEHARELAAQMPGARGVSDWRAVVDARDVEVVIVATPNDLLVPIAEAAIAAGKHVLVEKPGARTVSELDRLIAAADRGRPLVRVGFNHRYHPALVRARELCESGALGDLMFVRGRYGHGGRVGYEREWRADPLRSGGGELIDQGVHLIDLARVFLGDFAVVLGSTHTYFWRMPVDDNAFMLLETARGQAAWLHVSCTEWKNLFSLEIYGRTGKLHAEGLGGSYGVERLSYFKMSPQMGPPETTIWEYPGADRSWRLEFEEFLEDIQLNRPPRAGLADARAVLQIVERLYNDATQITEAH
jgi:predicted dehydrogenase